MPAVPLLLLAASLAASAAEPRPADQETHVRLDGVHETVRSSLKDLDRALRPLEELSAAYAGDAASAGPERRGALRDEVSLHSRRLNQAYDSFWPLWDLLRFTEGARLMGGLASGAHKPEDGSAFLDDSAIDDFKAEVKRMQERAAAALKNEEEAFKAFEERRRARLFDRLLAAGAGAAVAALGAALLAWLRTERAPAPGLEP